MPSVYWRETDLNSTISALGLEILVKTPSDTLHRRLKFQVYSFLAYIRSIYYRDNISKVQHHVGDKIEKD
jgi:hypothetical protein